MLKRLRSALSQGCPAVAPYVNYTVSNACVYEGLRPDESVGWLNGKNVPIDRLPGCVGLEHQHKAVQVRQLIAPLCRTCLGHRDQSQRAFHRDLEGLRLEGWHFLLVGSRQ